jgi:hypothetical protein
MSLTLMNKNGGAMEIEMVRNGIRVAYGYGGATGYNMATQVAIVMLEKGDMVWVNILLLIRHPSCYSYTQVLLNYTYMIFNKVT